MMVKKRTKNKSLLAKILLKTSSHYESIDETDASENMNKLCWFSRFKDLHISDSVEETIDYEEDK